MEMLSEDDLNLREMNDEELALAWDLWFDLAQETNAFDPPYEHGVFAGMTVVEPSETAFRGLGRPIRERNVKTP